MAWQRGAEQRTFSARSEFFHLAPRGAAGRPIGARFMRTGELGIEFGEGDNVPHAAHLTVLRSRAPMDPANALHAA
jgi:hypothetical protein